MKKIYWKIYWKLRQAYYRTFQRPNCVGSHRTFLWKMIARFKSKMDEKKEIEKILCNLGDCEPVKVKPTAVVKEMFGHTDFHKPELIPYNWNQFFEEQRIMQEQRMRAEGFGKLVMLSKKLEDDKTV